MEYKSKKQIYFSDMKGIESEACPNIGRGNRVSYLWMRNFASAL